MGVIALKNKASVPVPTSNALASLGADLLGNVVVKDAAGAQRSAFASRLRLSAGSTPSATANRTKLYTRMVDGVAALFCKDSAGNEIRLTRGNAVNTGINGSFFAEKYYAKVNFTLAPDAAEVATFDTGVILDPPQGESCIYVLQSAFVVSFDGIVAPYMGSCILLFDGSEGTPETRFLGADLPGMAGVMPMSSASVAADGELTIEFDNTSGPAPLLFTGNLLFAGAFESPFAFGGG